MACVLALGLLTTACWALAEWHAWLFPDELELDDDEVDDDSA